MVIPRVMRTDQRILDLYPGFDANGRSRREPAPHTLTTQAVGLSYVLPMHSLPSIIYCYFSGHFAVFAIFFDVAIGWTGGGPK